MLTVTTSSWGWVYPQALKSVVAKCGKHRPKTGLLLQVLCLWKHTKISREGLFDCFHNSSLLSAVRYNWWIDGWVGACRCYFCFSYLNSVYEPQSFVLPDHVSGHGNLRLALFPVLPRSCWRMVSPLYILYLPAPHCPHYTESNAFELHWLHFPGRQKPIVAFQVHSGWGAARPEAKPNACVD